MIRTLLSSLRRRRYEHRYISLHGMVTEQKTLHWVAQLLSFAHESSGAPVTLYVDSPGGMMAESITILRTMDDLSCPFATHCHGLAGGTAAAIVAHGRRRFRTAISTARFSFAPVFADPAKGYVEAELSQFDTVLREHRRGHRQARVGGFFAVPRSHRTQRVRCSPVRADRLHRFIPPCTAHGLTTRSSEQRLAAGSFPWLSPSSPASVAELGFVRNSCIMHGLDYLRASAL